MKKKEEERMENGQSASEERNSKRKFGKKWEYLGKKMEVNENERKVKARKCYQLG